MGEAEFEVLEEASGGEVRGGDERGAGVGGAAEQVRLSVEELLQVAADLHIRAAQPVEHRPQFAGGAARRKAGEVPLGGQLVEVLAECLER